MTNIEADRRDLILGPMLALAAISLGIGAGRAAGVDPAMTIIKRPDEIPRKPLYNFPPGMAELATMFGAIDASGQYFVLIRWHPGYMSAPHWYETDRLCVVLSGTWYVASGEDFAPDATVPALSCAGSPGRPLRRGQERRRRASDHSDLRHRADPLSLDGHDQTGMARALIAPSKRDERAGEAPAPAVELTYKT